MLGHPDAVGARSILRDHTQAPASLADLGLDLGSVEGAEVDLVEHLPGHAPQDGTRARALLVLGRQDGLAHVLVDGEAAQLFPSGADPLFADQPLDVVRHRGIGGARKQREARRQLFGIEKEQIGSRVGFGHGRRIDAQRCTRNGRRGGFFVVSLVLSMRASWRPDRDWACGVSVCMAAVLSSRRARQERGCPKSVTLSLAVGGTRSSRKRVYHGDVRTRISEPNASGPFRSQGRGGDHEPGA